VVAVPADAEEFADRRSHIRIRDDDYAPTLAITAARREPSVVEYLIDRRWWNRVGAEGSHAAGRIALASSIEPSFVLRSRASVRVRSVNAGAFMRPASASSASARLATASRPNLSKES
jgi:hypothetical protein